jgi:hypothetical protein
VRNCNACRFDAILRSSLGDVDKRVGFSAQCRKDCGELTYNSPTYSEKVDELAVQTRLPDAACGAVMLTGAHSLIIFIKTPRNSGLEFRPHIFARINTFFP